MSGSRLHPPDAPLAEPPTWGCFVGLGLAGLPLLALTASVWTRPGWDADVLGGLLVAVFGLPLGGVLLVRLGHWLWSRGARDMGAWPIPRARPAPATATCLERDRPTVSGVLLLWGMALIWDVPVGVAAVGALRLLAQGKPSVPLLVFVGLFALFGLMLLGLAGYASLEEWPGLRGLRAPVVEVTAHPLRPGGTYELAVSQPGPLRLHTWHVVLRCERHVPQPDGEGGTYDKMETAFEAELLREADLRIEATLPHTARCPFSLPADARPSRSEEPNKVRWMVRVAGRRTGWHRRFRFDYPVQVSPSDEAAASA
jgi:hypothetical protein